ncbi:SAM-dependent methyltransferase [Burkholderia pseudomallei]|uniref:SAM-dependent methyltransferase n=1 Tax=Burkholderia pseudomallei TaxID=28450 RepID=UPI0005387BB6|nr:SAM-dependent methyltransferase [Burkholderia pseudomallei]KGW38672.1 DNA methylase family protein [Burkholderia pseudomallei MSHR1000]
MSTVVSDKTTHGYRRVESRTILKDVGGSSFVEWTAGRTTDSPSTNAGSDALPFQRWHRFKEAFSPELIAEAVRSSPVPVRRLADPFGGSGTSALAAQFLGVEPVTIEVNPFLADLIAAKLCSYRVPSLLTALSRVTRKATLSRRRCADLIRRLPATFVEPGVKDRWLFDLPVAIEILRLRMAIEDESNPAIARLFRVLLGGLIVGFSNAVVSGKGRRYRENWQERRVDPKCVIPTFANAVAAAIVEITACGSRAVRTATVLHGDSRELFAGIQPVDQIVCSPPYPNSFDYTDVYNMELWMLGYLASSEGNASLRRSTLSSHVQISRDFEKAPSTPTLDRTLRALNRVADELWDSRIPAMVGAYFSDLRKLLQASAQLLPQNGQAWFVVGDSQYAKVHVQVAKILTELAPAVGLRVERIAPFRSMRVSPQQSGRHMLSEDLVVFSRG